MWKVVFEICERTARQKNRQTDIQTHRHADHNTLPNYQERSKYGDKNIYISMNQKKKLFSSI